MLPITQITQTANLLSTVLDGVCHCVNRKDSFNLLEEIINALKAITTAPILSGETIPEYNTMVSLLKDPKTCDDQVLPYMQFWYIEVCNILNRKMMEMLPESGALREEECKLLFDYLDQILIKNQNYNILAFNVCMRADYTIPEESYIRMKRLFEQCPTLIKGEVHPDYVYQCNPHKQFTKCPICGGKGHAYYSAFSYMAQEFRNPYLPVKLWLKCSVCKNLYVMEFPEERLAMGTCGKWVEPEFSQEKYMEDLGYMIPIWCKILNSISSFTSGKSLLDVGIGQGVLLAVALEMGFIADAVELDYGNAKKVADTLNLPVWNGDFLKFQTDKKYSVITMGDVVEHLPDPVLALKKAYELLEDNGVLWLSTPNYESAFSKMMKFKDPMWKEPDHIIYLSYEGAKVLLAQAGFEVKNYEVSSRYNGSMELIAVKKIILPDK